LKINNNFYGRVRVRWAIWNEAARSQFCGGLLEALAPPHYPVFVSKGLASVAVDLENGTLMKGLLSQVLKDSILLKRGVLIYLKHLVPYFQRSTTYPHQEYSQLKALLLADIQQKVRDHGTQLEKLLETVEREIHFPSDIPKYLNLDQLFLLVESEIYVELLKNAFSDDRILSYLNAIKQLEHRLYSNYNTVVLLYVKCL
jgi:hypothetical protein